MSTFVDYATLLFAAVAAFGTVWGSVVAARAARRASERPAPIFVLTIQSRPEAPGWFGATLRITHNGPTELVFHGIRSGRLGGTRLAWATQGDYDVKSGTYRPGAPPTATFDLLYSASPTNDDQHILPDRPLTMRFLAKRRGVFPAVRETLTITYFWADQRHQLMRHKVKAM